LFTFLWAKKNTNGFVAKSDFVFCSIVSQIFRRYCSPLILGLKTHISSVNVR